MSRLLAVRTLSQAGWSTEDLASLFRVSKGRVRKWRMEIRRLEDEVHARARDLEAARREADDSDLSEFP